MSQVQKNWESFGEMCILNAEDEQRRKAGGGGITGVDRLDFHYAENTADPSYWLRRVGDNVRSRCTRAGPNLTLQQIRHCRRFRCRGGVAVVSATSSYRVGGVAATERVVFVEFWQATARTKKSMTVLKILIGIIQDRCVEYIMCSQNRFAHSANAGL